MQRWLSLVAVYPSSVLSVVPHVDQREQERRKKRNWLDISPYTSWVWPIEASYSSLHRVHEFHLDAVLEKDHLVEL